jgi:hypothetical protein
MVFLGVYYTLLDIGELGAEGLMLTVKPLLVDAHGLTVTMHMV